jgi:Zn-dependent M32 family carboxypeptidase
LEIRNASNEKKLIQQGDFSETKACLPDNIHHHGGQSLFLDAMLQNHPGETLNLK